MLLSSAFAASSMAGPFLYDFVFTQGAGTQVQSFGFSFTAPTIVTAGQAPAFTPFAISDGINPPVTMTRDFVGLVGGIGCFLFASATAAPFSPSTCGSDNTALGAAAIGFSTSFITLPGLPTTTGVFTLLGNGGIHRSDNTVAFAGENRYFNHHGGTCDRQCA